MMPVRTTPARLQRLPARLQRSPAPNPVARRRRRAAPSRTQPIPAPVQAARRRNRTPLARMPTTLALLAAVVLLASCSSATDLSAQQAAEEPAPIEAGIAPPPGPYAPGFDALHYDLALELPDAGSFLEGRMQGRFRLVAPRHDTLSLDLTGLAVDAVAANGAAAPHRHHAGKLHIAVPSEIPVGDTLEVAVTYHGEPDDGFILGRNVHGSPTAFADNWPDRSRFWFPSIDHPSDKATVQFDVRVNRESGRRVIANGTFEATDDESTWRWVATEPIPTYAMVVGVAEFEVDTVGEACFEDACTEVTTWLFPPDAERGAASFRRAAEMVEYYSALIAPFPYSKLAHVQSSTRFGGMENASAIFYPEQTIMEGRDIELTVAHETAHQWFGDAVTIADWHHLWLSEGFASYFAALFFEQADGSEALREVMEGYSNIYLESGAWREPMVYPEQDNLFGLLNANNYQKGAWMLHMLRNELGDDVFFEGIRAYYREHEHATALTEDLRNALESATGTSLESFFERWVYRPGHPQLEVDWEWHDAEATIVVRQTQPRSWPVFRFPLELAFETSTGTIRRTIRVDERRTEVQVALPSRPSDLEVDPRGVLLKETVSVEPVGNR